MSENYGSFFNLDQRCLHSNEINTEQKETKRNGMIRMWLIILIRFPMESQILSNWIRSEKFYSNQIYLSEILSRIPMIKLMMKFLFRNFYFSPQVLAFPYPFFILIDFTSGKLWHISWDFFCHSFQSMIVWNQFLNSHPCE